MLSYLLPGNNTPCTYSQGNLFLLLGITFWQGKEREKNSYFKNQTSRGQFNLSLLLKTREVFITLSNIKGIYYTKA